MSEAQPEAGALERAEHLISMKRFDLAGAELAPYLACHPSDGRALCLLAQARLGGGDPRGAYDAAERAIHAQPDDEWALRLSSIALMQLDMPAGSADRARAAVRVAPHLPSTHAQLAFALASGKKDLAEGAQAAAEAVRLAPYLPQSHIAVGAVALARKDRDTATAAFEAALALDPTNAVARNELARAQLIGSRFGGSRRMATAAGGFASVVRSDPNEEVSRRNIDVVLAAFLSRLAYYVFLVDYLLARVLAHNAYRWVGAVAIALPAVFAVQFLTNLTPSLRRYLWGTFRRPPRAIAGVLLTVGAALVVVGAFAASAAPALFGTGSGAALVARLVLYTDHRRAGLTRSRRPRSR